VVSVTDLYGRNLGFLDRWRLSTVMKQQAKACNFHCMNRTCPVVCVCVYVMLNCVQEGYHIALHLTEIMEMVCTLQVWSSGQSSWLEIQMSRFDSRCYQIF
jgi:hypothetical protein